MPGSLAATDKEGNVNRLSTVIHRDGMRRLGFLPVTYLTYFFAGILYYIYLLSVLRETRLFKVSHLRALVSTTANLTILMTAPVSTWVVLNVDVSGI